MVKKLLDFDAKSLKEKDENIRISKVSAKDIAIIGISLRLPMANNLGEYWENIQNKVDCIGQIPESRRRDLEEMLLYKNMTNPKYPEKAYLAEIDKFDYAYFGISPKEASLIDPNQRIFLEVAWEAIEDGGYGGNKLRGSRTGVFLGFGSEMTYMRFIQEIEPESSVVALPGNLPAIISGRLAHILDLKGPNMAIDTTCSSALVALHYACQAIRNGECNMAVAGTVALQLLSVDIGQRIGIEATDNRARTFDDTSDGTGSGEGVAVILLKPLGKALDDGDNIYAVIKGSAVNHDGNSIGLTAPNPAAQEEVIIRAWKNAEIEPETISYIEAHGTGTKLGDPIEIEGIRRAFGHYTSKKSFCGIGSVKTNIGHLDSAAGLAGLLKAVMALKEKKIPPTIHFNRPNRQICFEESPVYVNDQLRNWDPEEYPRRCGVSSFGMSGTNCHLILEEAPEVDKKETPVSVPLALTISAKSEEVLKDFIRAYKTLLNKTNVLNIHDLCFTANTGRGHYEYRLAIFAKTPEKLRETLQTLDEELSEGNRDKGIFYGKYKLTSASKRAPEEGEITTEEAAEIDRTAGLKLKEYLASAERDAELFCEILGLYIKGANIEWDEIYKGGGYNRISIPVYPFARKRCWLDLQAMDCKDQSTFYHVPCWEGKCAPARAEYETKEMNGAVLILEDETGLGLEVAARFREQGVEVIEACFGPAFRKTGENRYTLTGSKEDFDLLIEETKKSGLEKIIHLWTLQRGEEIKSLEELENSQRRGAYSLFHLTQSIIGANLKKEIDIVLVSEDIYEVTGAENRFRPENAPLLGLGIVVGMENLHLKCRCIDIDGYTGIEEFFPELANLTSDKKVAYRNGKRYVEYLKEADLSVIDNAPAGIRENGVYVITGGLGDIGLKIGKYLASLKKVNLALVNRSRLPARNDWDSIIEGGTDTGVCHKIRSIREMERMGAEVTCFSADISKMEELAAVIGSLKERYGRINGVIHCAAQGIGGEAKVINDETDESFTNILLPKVHGAWLLNTMTQEMNPDFFIMFSSGVTIMGGIGVGAYTSANAYLDTLASSIAKGGRRALAINWLTWKDTATVMGADEAEESRQIFKFITNEEGLSSFGELLTKNIKRVMSGRLNYDRILFLKDSLAFRLTNEFLEKLEKKRGKVRSGGGENLQALDVALKGRENDNYTDFEVKLAGLWGVVLGLKEININDNFFEIGGHSLLAMNLVDKIQKYFDVEITIKEAFGYQTVAEMADLIRIKSEQLDEIDHMLSNIENMSDEEVRYLLSQEQEQETDLY